MFLVPVLSPPFGGPISLVIALKSNTHQTWFFQCHYPSLLHPCSREGKFLLETASTCQSKLRGEVLHLQAKPRKYLPGFPPNLNNSWVSRISFFLAIDYQTFIFPTFSMLLHLLRVFTMTGHTPVTLLAIVIKIHQRSNLKEKGLILAKGMRGCSPPGQGRHGGRSRYRAWRSLVTLQQQLGSWKLDQKGDHL